MAKLTAATRNKIPDSGFGLPKQRKYPMQKPNGEPDKAHAINAKARATQQEKKGNLSHSEAQQIKAKANKMLSKVESHSKATGTMLKDIRNHAKNINKMVSKRGK